MLSPEVRARAKARLDAGEVVAIFEGTWAPAKQLRDMTPEEREAARVAFNAAVKDGRCTLRVFLPDGRTGVMGRDWLLNPDEPQDRAA
jgi:hypothetical protein